MRKFIHVSAALLLCGSIANAQQHKSDREDAGLKGKVKSIVVETEDLPNSSNHQSAGKRQSSYTELYDMQGNLTERLAYDYRGNLRDKIVYMTIDGVRASKTESIQHDYDPPPPMAPPAQGTPKQRDLRYGTKYKDTYDAKGNRIERVLIYNDGSQGTRLVYTFDNKGNKTKMKFYPSNETLEFITNYVYNSKGYQISEMSIKADGRLRYTFTYEYLEFDSKGNWTKRKKSKLANKNEQAQFEPFEITYRTITYL
jgi:hypothetical protein